MANITAIVAADIRGFPEPKSLYIRAQAAEALAPGQVVYMSGTANGDIPIVTRADGNAVATLHPILGIVVSGQNTKFGSTTIATGDSCDVVWMGLVGGFSGLTPGATIWVSDDVGQMGDTVGTKSTVVGVAVSATTILVRPNIGTVSA